MKSSKSDFYKWDLNLVCFNRYRSKKVCIFMLRLMRLWLHDNGIWFRLLKVKICQLHSLYSIPKLQIIKQLNRLLIRPLTWASAYSYDYSILQKISLIFLWMKESFAVGGDRPIENTAITVLDETFIFALRFPICSFKIPMS